MSADKVSSTGTAGPASAATHALPHVTEAGGYVLPGTGSDEASIYARANHAMAVCNACRYCEQYCPVFPAMERRLTFTRGDLVFLANLCHNCGECLYACQYAPPHEFRVNVPRTFAEIRLHSYRQHCWPTSLAAAYRRHARFITIALVMSFAAVIALTWSFAGAPDGSPEGGFYAIIPHRALVGLFTAASAFVLVAFGIGLASFWRHAKESSMATSGTAKAVPLQSPDIPPPFTGLSLATALRDALTLRHLHGTGAECTFGEERRSLARRWFHHFTMYGFLFCFASTTVAAVYEVVFGWLPPYAYTSAPVVLGSIGGVGLLIGPAGLLILKRRRDPDLGDPSQQELDSTLIWLLLTVSASGLLLLGLRDGPTMAPLLIVHLALVLTLFVSLPYGKFVHGLYRIAALVRDAVEERQGG